MSLWAATAYLVVNLLYPEVRSLKRVVKITFSALCVALGTVIMMLAYFPYFTYAVPAVAGLFSLIVMIEVKGKWPLATYIVTSVLVLLFAETEAKFLYVMFFGYYPIIKAYIERIPNRLFQYIIKFAVFNASILLFYLLFAKLFGISIDEFGQFGIFSSILFIILGNIAFLLYDIVLVRASNFYMIKLHSIVEKIKYW